MDLVLEDVDVVKEARGTLDMFETQAREKGLDISFASSVGIHRARLDRGALNSVLQNLYSNAIKFTDAGSVAVMWTAGTNAEATDGLDHVTDTGSGIDSAFIPQVFEEFQQESSGIRRVYEGAGLAWPS
jgi:signal transduction histidine kinase